jgi:hypothetical protein
LRDGEPDVEGWLEMEGVVEQLVASAELGPWGPGDPKEVGAKEEFADFVQIWDLFWVQ